MADPAKKLNPPPVLFDETQIRQTLELMTESDQVVEIRILKTGRTKTVRGYFDDNDAAVQAVKSWSGKAPAIYLTLNPVNPALLARAANRLESYAETSTLDTDIVRRRFLLVDIDPTRPSGISSSESEHASALDAARSVYQSLKQKHWPEPIAADSGNGAHLLYPNRLTQ